MKYITNIIICLSIALVTNIGSIDLAIAEDREMTNSSPEEITPAADPNIVNGTDITAPPYTTEEIN